MLQWREKECQRTFILFQRVTPSSAACHFVLPLFLRNIIPRNVLFLVSEVRTQLNREILQTDKIHCSTALILYATAWRCNSVCDKMSKGTGWPLLPAGPFRMSWTLNKFQYVFLTFSSQEHLQVQCHGIFRITSDPPGINERHRQISQICRRVIQGETCAGNGNEVQV